MQREVVLVLGKTGSGKTTWARRFIQTQTRVIVLDAGFQDYQVRSVSDLSELISVVDKLNVGGSGFFRITYTPRMYESPVIMDLSRVVANCWLVLEEADRMEDPKVNPEYDEIISRGRHYGVSILAVSLYPFKLPADLRRQATRIVCYRMHEPRDLDYLYDIIGEDVSKLPGLKPFHYLDWRAGHGSEIKTLDNGREERTVKSDVGNRPGDSPEVPEGETVPEESGIDL